MIDPVASLSFGKSWEFDFLQQEGNQRSRELFLLFVKLQKSVDAQSGMTVNLTAVMDWWRQIQNFTQQTWAKPSALLEILAASLKIFCQGQNVSDFQLGLQNSRREQWLWQKEHKTFVKTLRWQDPQQDNKTFPALVFSRRDLTPQELETLQKNFLGKNLTDLQQQMDFQLGIEKIEIQHPLRMWPDFFLQNP